MIPGIVSHAKNHWEERSVSAAFHHAWTADFQAQRRSLFPVPLLLGAAVLFAKQAVSRRVLLLALFSLSSYSLIAVGLHGIVQLR